MTATNETIKLTDSEWTLVSDQLSFQMQVIEGSMSLVFAASQPSSSITADQKGHRFIRGDWYSHSGLSRGTKTYGRAMDSSRAAWVVMSA